MTAGLVLVALLLTARYTLRHGARAGYLLVVVSVAWLLVNKRMEGVTVVRFTENHGLTAGDLAGLVGIGQAWTDLVRRAKRLSAVAGR